jgi:hypothetical protein
LDVHCREQAVLALELCSDEKFAAPCVQEVEDRLQAGDVGLELGGGQLGVLRQVLFLIVQEGGDAADQLDLDRSR